MSPKKHVKHKRFNLNLGEHFLSRWLFRMRNYHVFVCTRVSKGNQLDMHTHEEADTRMLLLAMDADLKFQDTDGRIIIKAPDTDVVVLAVYYFSQMKPVSEFWIETGRVKRTAIQMRFIPVHEICPQDNHSAPSFLSYMLSLVLILPQHYLENGRNMY